MNKSELKYAKSHEWVFLEGTTATVGITDFAVQSLTDLVYLELPAIGKTFRAGDSFGEVESVKAVSELLAPVDGEVIEVNTAVADDLEMLARDPYDEGWLIKLRLSGAVPEDLLDWSAYEKQCAEDH